MPGPGEDQWLNVSAAGQDYDRAGSFFAPESPGPAAQDPEVPNGAPAHLPRSPTSPTPQGGQSPASLLAAGPGGPLSSHTVRMSISSNPLSPPGSALGTPAMPEHQNTTTPSGLRSPTSDGEVSEPARKPSRLKSAVRSLSRLLGGSQVGENRAQLESEWEQRGGREKSPKAVAEEPPSMAAMPLSTARKNLAERHRQLHVLLPDAPWRRWWDAIVIFVTLFHGIVVPLIVIDILRFDDFSWPHLAASAFWMADSLIRMNTALIGTDGNLIVDMPRVRANYMLRWGLIDIACTFPFDVVMWHTVGYGAARYLCALRLLRVCHIRFVFVRSELPLMTPEYVIFNFTVAPKMVAGFWMALGLHFLVVLKLSVRVEGESEDARYDHALFWVWNLLTTSPAPLTLNSYYQKALCFFLMICGVFFQGVVIAKVSYEVLKHSMEEQNAECMRTTLQLIKQYRVPGPLQQEVLSLQWHTLQSSLSALGRSEILESLPPVMRNEILLYMKIDFINKVPMFTQAPHHTKVMLANSLEQLFVEPGEFIIKVGDLGQEMFFILHGHCDIIVPGVGSVKQLGRGDFFGEVALLTQDRRTATVRALTYCDCLRLSKGDFDAVCKDDPDFQKAIADEVAKRTATSKGGSGPPSAQQAVLPPPQAASNWQQPLPPIITSGPDDSEAPSMGSTGIVHKLASEQAAREVRPMDALRGVLQAIEQRRKSRAMSMISEGEIVEEEGESDMASSCATIGQQLSLLGVPASPKQQGKRVSVLEPEGTQANRIGPRGASSRSMRLSGSRNNLRSHSSHRVANPLLRPQDSSLALNNLRAEGLPPVGAAAPDATRRSQTKPADMSPPGTPPLADLEPRVEVTEPKEQHQAKRESNASVPGVHPVLESAPPPTKKLSRRQPRASLNPHAPGAPSAGAGGDPVLSAVLSLHEKLAVLEEKILITDDRVIGIAEAQNSQIQELRESLAELQTLCEADVRARLDRERMSISTQGGSGRWTRPGSLFGGGIGPVRVAVGGVQHPAQRGPDRRQSRMGSIHSLIAQG
eukprot:TRINITY_DN47419_c0_g1_i1.p1 TRINITY_DN47419_c0_g1~~TRINITY_DN47419_c0_g1_i1.p1  ORF type:complete len:1078 (+),score=326.34 TRINITY_DN47419_c0_g1_i1:121-3234(+)